MWVQVRVRAWGQVLVLVRMRAWMLGLVQVWVQAWRQCQTVSAMAPAMVVVMVVALVMGLVLVLVLLLVVAVVCDGIWVRRRGRHPGRWGHGQGRGRVMVMVMGLGLTPGADRTDRTGLGRIRAQKCSICLRSVGRRTRL